MPVSIPDLKNLVYNIDKHHEYLVKFLSRMYRYFQVGAPAEDFGHAIKELTDYTSFHFICEEQWMNLTCYPEICVHKEEHRRFASGIAEVRVRLAGDDGRSSLDELLMIISSFTQHILVTDRAYRNYITNNAKVCGELMKHADFSSQKDAIMPVVPETNEAELRLKPAFDHYNGLSISGEGSNEAQ
jgi:hemerythrin